MPPAETAPETSGADTLPRRAGELATRAAQRMSAEHAWFRTLSPDDRSWVGLVAQAGINALLRWYAAGAPEDDVSGRLFASAPRSLAQTITLRQALDLTRTAIATVEDAVPELVGEDEQARLREAVLRYSREVAFAAAQVYAQAAESRGAWDARLESLVVHAVMRGEADQTLQSRAAELGWQDVRSVAVVVGPARYAPSSAGVADSLRSEAERLGCEALSAVQGPRLVTVLGNTEDALASATRLVTHFGEGPVVVGPTVPTLFAAGRSARAALSGMDAARAWPTAPRPVAAAELLAERALIGEQQARRLLVERVHRPLRDTGHGLHETASAFLDAGGGLEATGRALFVHPNTVRYRLRRIADVTGLDLTDPRDAWIARTALAYGRLADQPPAAWRAAVTPPQRP